LYTIADLLIRRFLGRRRRHAKSAEQSGLAIAAGSLIDNVPEGIVIGIGAIGGPVSPALLAAVCLSNLPEALASAAPACCRPPRAVHPRRLVGDRHARIHRRRAAEHAAEHGALAAPSAGREPQKRHARSRRDRARCARRRGVPLDPEIERILQLREAS
jgi:hypothetical protein